MCGRYYVGNEISKELERMAGKLDRGSGGIEVTTGEIFPTNDVAVLVAKGNKVELERLKWGFPNFMGRGVVINARAETAFEKPMFRDSLISRRCVIPASGFFEWNKNKEKNYFTPQSETIMYMAGIYNIYENEPRFVILTTSANSSIEDVHDRMPLLLMENQIEEWIFDGAKTPIVLKQTSYQLKRESEFEQQTLNLL